jgi:hypothetical protein
MNVEPVIVQLLSGLVEGRVFPDMAPEGVAVPFIVYQQVGGQAPSFLENNVPSMKNGRFQISVWAGTRAHATTLGGQIEEAMVAAAEFQARPLSAALYRYESDTQLRGSSQDFTIWSDR